MEKEKTTTKKITAIKNMEGEEVIRAFQEWMTDFLYEKMKGARSPQVYVSTRQFVKFLERRGLKLSFIHLAAFRRIMAILAMRSIITSKVNVFILKTERDREAIHAGIVSAWIILTGSEVGKVRYS